MNPGMMPVGVTPELNETVLEFCRSVRADAAPELLPVRPAPGSDYGNCYENVDLQIAAAQGTKLHGWAIWLHRGLMLEAEHHAVWVSPDGEKVDVSPQRAANRVMFVPDAAHVYNNISIPSIRRGIVDHADMPRFLELLDKVDAVRVRMASKHGATVMTPEVMNEMLPIFKKSMELRQRIETGAMNPRQRAEQRKKDRKRVKKER